MKKIEAIIRTDRVPYLKKSLAEKGLTALTVYEVKGRGKQSGIVQMFNGKKVFADLLLKTKVEIIVHDNEVDGVISVFLSVCQSGNIGDGKIFITLVEDVVRIRDGARGSEIL